MKNLKKKLMNIQMPHTYVILTVILLAVVAMTYLIPAGAYDRVLDQETGNMIVAADSFHYTEAHQVRDKE